MRTGALLCLLFCFSAADILNLRFPERYTTVFSTTGQGQTFNTTLVTNGNMSASLARIYGESLRTFQYKENMTSYMIGIPGLEQDKCSGLWYFPTDPMIDFFSDANKKAKLIGKCRTGTFSIGLLWQYIQVNSVMEICTNLFASEPVWSKTNVTSGGQVYSSEAKYFSFSTKVDESSFTLPTSCYLAVNSRQHPLHIPNVWYATLNHTKPEPVDVINGTVIYANVTTHHVAIQDAQGQNVIVEGYDSYDVHSEEGTNWSMFFPQNKTMYHGYKNQKNCSCTSDTSSYADPTVTISEASKDERGIRAVYTGVPCKTTNTGDVFGYWYNGIVSGERFCIRFDGAEPISMQERDETWNYGVFRDDKDVSGVIQLPERCFNTPCHL